jgi:general secretion pathway protein A
MYRDFFQLNERPFTLTPAQSFLFLSASHQEALNHLLYGVRERKGFIEVIGEPGTGKTSLCRHFLDSVEADTHTAYIFNTRLSDVELLRAINEEFGLATKSKDRKELTDSLSRFLMKTAAKGGNAVLLIDEAQSLTDDALEQLHMLSNLETTEKLIQIVLVGQPELHAKLSRPELRHLNERVVVRHRLEPLSRAECESYIMHRLRVAGWRGVPQIEAAAVAAVWKCSDGLPRRINVICDRALLVAFNRASHRVEKADIGQARTEVDALDGLGGSLLSRLALPKPPEGSWTEGSWTEGFRTEGSWTEGFRTEGSWMERLRRPWAAACVLALVIGAGGWWFGGSSRHQAQAQVQAELESAAVRQACKIDQAQKLVLEEQGKGKGK